MKKNLQKIGLGIILITITLSINMTLAQAKNLTPQDYLKSIGTNTGLPSFDTQGQHPDAPSDYVLKGVGTVTSPIYFALDLFKYAISGIAFLIIIVSAIKLISTSTDEEAGKVKNHLAYGVLGLVLIQVADVFVKKVFFGEQGEAFEDIATAQLYAEEGTSQIRGIIGLVNLFLASIATLAIIIRGFTLLTGGGEEESITKAKTHIMYALVGLVAIGLSEIVIRGFIFPEQGSALPNAEVGKHIIVSMTNYVSGFIAILSFAVLFYAGYRYVISGGSEEVNETVKKSFLGAVIGLAISLGAFALVQTFVTLDNTTGKIPTPPVQNESAPATTQ